MAAHLARHTLVDLRRARELAVENEPDPFLTEVEEAAFGEVQPVKGKGAGERTEFDGPYLFNAMIRPTN